MLSALASCVLLLVGVEAYVGLVPADPAVGTTVVASPTAVRLNVSGDLVNPAFVTVTASDGSTASVRNPEVVGARVQHPVDSTATDEGVYPVFSRVAAADAHPVTSTLSFIVGESSIVNQDAGAVTGTTPSVEPVSLWERPAVLLVLFAGAGGGLAWFLTLERSERTRANQDSSA